MNLTAKGLKQLLDHAEASGGLLNILNPHLHLMYYRGDDNTPPEPPPSDDDTATIVVITEPDSESDTWTFDPVEDSRAVVLVFEATGAEGERLHPAPCGYPEYLCSCGIDDVEDDQ